MVKKVLITGANGFLGAVLQEYFKEQQPFFKIFGVARRISLFLTQGLLFMDHVFK